MVNGVLVMDCVDFYYEYLVEFEKGRFKIDNMWLIRMGFCSVVSYGRDVWIRELFDCGVDIDVRDEGGFIVFMWVVDGGYLLIVCFLVENGVDLDVWSD